MTSRPPVPDIDTVNSRDEFLRYVESLLAAFQTGAAEWENVTADAFLEALVAYARDAEIPADASWRTFATLLRAGTSYE